MITSIECPACHTEFLFEETATVQATRIMQDSGVEVRRRLKDVRVTNTYNKEDKFKEIILNLNSKLKNDISIDELENILQNEYKLSRCCTDMLIDEIKENYSMYSPDGKHLYFF